MTDPKPQQQEPSMEEILASIRKIISEDGDSDVRATNGAAAEDEILELTEEVPDEAPPPTPPEPPPEPVAEPEPVPAPEPIFEPPPEPAEKPVEIEAMDTDDSTSPAPMAALDETLISKGVAKSSENSLAALAAAVSRGSGDVVLGTGERTLEDLVKEVMRPMIKEWLDANLPGLVEHLVGREIDRLSRRAEDRY